MLSGRLTDDRGFTLPEVLISCTLGVVVLLAAFQVMDTAVQTQSDASARVESVQGGRDVMNRLGRVIRSQTCLGDANPSITAASPTSLQMTTSIGPEQLNPGYQALQRRTLTYDPTLRTITETTVDGVGAPPGTTWTGATTNRVIAERVRLDGSIPLFRYYALQGNPAQATLEVLPGGGLTLPSGKVNLAKIVRIDVNFLIRSRDASATSKLARYSGRYWVRTADPSDVDAGGGCT
jgi:prepilin-type N-terminal cleavage/methylation domain-containing protein